MEKSTKTRCQDALLEILSEELPSSYITPALEQIRLKAEEFLKDKRLAFESIATYATPRRLVLYITGIEDKSTDIIQEFMGPAAKFAIDEKGVFNKAAEGFAAKHGVNSSRLKIKSTPKGEYVIVEKKISGEKAKSILKDMFPGLIENISFPKAMAWGKERFKFARPIRAILALYGSEVVKFSIAGVKSSNWTNGLLVGGAKKIIISSCDKYMQVLRNNLIIADHVVRKEVVKKVVEQASKRAKAEAIVDEDLLNEVNFLVEHPVGVLGTFKEEYLRLPKEVLITCMKKKQKYFSLVDDKKKLVNSFIGIRNGVSENQEIVKEGYERVLTARLSDAQFFFEQDTKTTLESKLEKLKGVVFHKDLGTVYEKVFRVQEIALNVNAILKETGQPSVEPDLLKEAIKLFKADIVSEMVFEYPELQGIMGRVYSNHDGAVKEISRAIEEHYMPVGSEGNVANSVLGQILSISDKIDSLFGYFAIGIEPTGSQDPYAQRRLAQGIVRTLLEKHLDISISQLIEKASFMLTPKLKENGKEANICKAKELTKTFLRQRLEGILSNMDFRFDEIKAVLATGWEDLGDVVKRLEAIKNMRKDRDFGLLAMSFKRASNILKQADKLDIPLKVNEEYLLEDAEKKLFVTLENIEISVKAVLAEKDYFSALKRMVEIKPDLDKFFDEVLVMSKDENIKLNRFALINSATRFFFNILDFSQLQV